jgi:pyruvate formate lyase activating enzyme
VLNRRQCDGCGLCAEACPHGALEKTGRFYSLKDLLDEIEKDLPFYKLSLGGVTISGGEPAGQAEFVAAFLRQCRKRQIHTAVETSGFAPWPALASWLESLDLLFFNLNHMDPGKHKELTGVSNQKILRNIQKAAGRVPVILRLLLVPGLNDQPDNLAGVVRFAQGLGQSLVRVELIPFYRQGEEVYRKLRKEYPLSSVQPLENEIIEKLKDTIESQGLKAQIGG